MPDLNHITPPGYKPYRLYGVSVHDKFTRNFIVPQFEIGIIKEGWRGLKIDVVETADCRDISDNADDVYRNLCSRYGEPSVQRYHAGPQRLADDMAREARATAEFLEKCRANEEAETKKRVAAERQGAADRAEILKAQEREREEREATAMAKANANLASAVQQAVSSALDAPAATGVSAGGHK